MTRDDLKGVFKDPALFDFHGADGVQAFLQGVAASPGLQAKLVDHSTRLRANLLKYLDTVVDLAATKNVALLDLGYAGTIQSVLQTILKREGRTVELTGLYVAVNEVGRDRVLAGVDLRALVDRDGFSGSLVRMLERTPDILEHACMCPEGSLESFDDSGAPVLLPSQRSVAQIKQMETLQEGVLEGVEQCLSVLGADAVGSAAFLAHAGEIVRQAMLRPTPQEISTIGAWQHEANFDLEDQRALADLRCDAARLEYGGVEAWVALGRHEAYWPYAALSRISPVMAEAAAAIEDGGIEFITFSSGNSLGDLLITPDLGVGPEQRLSVSVPLSVSSIGRAELRVPIKSFGPEAFTSFTVAWPKATSVVSLALCGLVFQGETQQNVVQVTDQVAFDGDMTHHQGYIEIGAGGAEMTCDLSKSVVAWPHQLDLVMRFTYARLGNVM